MFYKIYLTLNKTTTKNDPILQIVWSVYAFFLLPFFCYFYSSWLLLTRLIRLYCNHCMCIKRILLCNFLVWNFQMKVLFVLLLLEKKTSYVENRWAKTDRQKERVRERKHQTIQLEYLKDFVCFSSSLQDQQISLYFIPINRQQWHFSTSFISFCFSSKHYRHRRVLLRLYFYSLLSLLATRYSLLNWIRLETFNVKIRTWTHKPPNSSLNVIFGFWKTNAKWQINLVFGKSFLRKRF